MGMSGAWVLSCGPLLGGTLTSNCWPTSVTQFQTSSPSEAQDSGANVVTLGNSRHLGPRTFHQPRLSTSYRPSWTLNELEYHPGVFSYLKKTPFHVQHRIVLHFSLSTTSKPDRRENWHHSFYIISCPARTANHLLLWTFKDTFSLKPHYWDHFSGRRVAGSWRTYTSSRFSQAMGILTPICSDHR